MATKNLPGIVLTRYMSEADYILNDPVLGAGEIAMTAMPDNKPAKHKVGDGVKKWTELSYSDSALKDDIASLTSRVNTLENYRNLHFKGYAPTIDSLPFGTEDSIFDSFPLITDLQLANAELMTQVGTLFPNAPIVDHPAYILLRNQLSTILTNKSLEIGDFYFVGGVNSSSTPYVLVQTDVSVTYGSTPTTETVSIYKWEVLGGLTADQINSIDTAIGNNTTDIANLRTDVDYLKGLKILNFKGLVPVTSNLPIASAFKDVAKAFPILATTPTAAQEAILASEYGILAGEYDTLKATFTAANIPTNVKVGDVYFVGTSFNQIVPYVYADATVTVDGESCTAYKWAPLSKIYDDEIQTINTAINTLNTTVSDHTTRIEDLETNSATHQEVTDKIAELGNLFEIKGILESTAALPGHDILTGKVLTAEGITEAEITAAGSNLLTTTGPGDVWIIGPASEENKAEYVFVKFTDTNSIVRYKWELLGDIAGVDLEDYYNKTIIDTKLNDINTTIGDLGIVYNYKGNVAATSNLPVLLTGTEDLVVGASFDSTDGLYPTLISDFQTRLEAANIKLGDSYIVGTLMKDQVTYAFIKVVEGTVETYRWQPIVKLYDTQIAAMAQDIEDLKASTSNLEGLDFVNLKADISTLDELPGNTLLRIGFPYITNANGVANADNTVLTDVLTPAQVTDYEVTKIAILDGVKFGDVHYLKDALDPSPDAAIPYILVKVTNLTKEVIVGGTPSTVTYDVYKWIVLSPSKTQFVSLATRMSSAETAITTNATNIADNTSRISALENAGYATVTEVDDKISALGNLFEIRGLVPAIENLPGYGIDPNVMVGLTEAEVEVITTAGVVLGVGDTYLVGSVADDNKKEYTWIKYFETVPNPAYVDPTTTPTEPETISIVKYRYELLGSIAGVDLEQFYTKTQADTRYVLATDDTIVRTTDTVIIDANGTQVQVGGTTLADTKISFTEASTFEPIQSTDSLETIISKLAKWHDVITDNSTIADAKIAFTEASTFEAISPDDTLEVLVSKLSKWYEVIQSTLAKAIDITLTAAGWTGTVAPYTQTVAVAGITADSNGNITLQDGFTADQYNACASAEIVKYSQADGTITFQAMSEKPSIDLPMRVTLL